MKIVIKSLTLYRNIWPWVAVDLFNIIIFFNGMNLELLNPNASEHSIHTILTWNFWIQTQHDSTEMQILCSFWILHFFVIKDSILPDHFFLFFFYFRNGVFDSLLCTDGWTTRLCSWSRTHTWVGCFFNQEHRKECSGSIIKRRFSQTACWWYVSGT